MGEFDYERKRFEAIISQDAFDRVQELLEPNSRVLKKNPSHCLVGKVFCENCRQRMVHSNKGKPKYYCNTRYLNEDNTECVTPLTRAGTGKTYASAFSMRELEYKIKRKLKERIMIMKDKEVLREKLIETLTKNEASYSRIYRHTQDDSSFAIIGCEDKDTKRDRSKELYDLIWKYNKKRGRGIGFNKAKGRYIYQDNINDVIAYEKSFILYDISREIALDIANKLNQESIVWKDKDFFGILYADGSIMLEFENKPGNNMNFKGDKGFGTQLLNDKSTKLGSAFEGVIYYSVVSDGKINIEEESFVFFSK